MNDLTLAVVIPTWNEAEALPAMLKSLQLQSQPAEQILVVDGNSSDATTAIVKAAGVGLLIANGRGRGHQIAAGLRQLNQAIILVGHADMLFPVTALERIRQYLRDHPDCPGGCLGHRFASTRWQYRLIEWFDRQRAMRGLSYGDQAQFFRRECLAQVGGFPDQPIMEDFELSHRLMALGRPAYLNQLVTVSPRRFERQGIGKTLYANWRIRRQYHQRGNSAPMILPSEYYDEQQK